MAMRRWATMAAVVALGLVVPASASALGSPHIRTDPGASLLVGSTTFKNTSADSATLDIPTLGTIHCSQTSFVADATANTSATTFTLTGTLTSLTLSFCTDSIPALDFPDCTLRPGTTPTLGIEAGAPSRIRISTPIVRCQTPFLITFCEYSPGSAPIGFMQALTSNLTYNMTGMTNLGTGAGHSCGTTPATLRLTLTDLVQTGTNRTITITSF